MDLICLNSARQVGCRKRRSGRRFRLSHSWDQAMQIGQSGVVERVGTGSLSGG